MSNSRIVTAFIVCLMVARVTGSPPMLRTVCGAVADAEEVVGNKAMAAGKVVGQMVLKPIAIVGGLKAAAVGAGIKASGGAIKFVGSKMVKDGSIMEAAGAGVKGAGLGVAAMAVRPAAEKIVAVGQMAEKSLDQAQQTANSIVQSVGDTSIQIDARIDSPILGHHHKNVNVSAGMATAAEQLNQISGDGVKGQIAQQEEAVKTESQQREKRAAKIDSEVMKSALSLVKEAKMEDCIARAVCDLNCNPQGFGQDGKQVFMTMVRLQGSKLLEDSDSKYFTEAAGKGRSGKCEQCSTLYKCSSKSSDLIKLASHIRMD